MSDPDWTKNFIRPTVAAGVLFTDEQDRILMVVPSYKDYLDIPGGYVEQGETPHQAAEREVFEELGIRPPIGRLLVADWWEDSPETNLGSKLLLIFDGGVLGDRQVDTITIDGDEILDFQFCRPNELNDATISRLANRLLTAAESRSRQSVCYLENGQSSVEPGGSGFVS